MRLEREYEPKLGSRQNMSCYTHSRGRTQVRTQGPCEAGVRVGFWGVGEGAAEGAGGAGKTGCLLSELRSLGNLLRTRCREEGVTRASNWKSRDLRDVSSALTTLTPSIPSPVPAPLPRLNWPPGSWPFVCPKGKKSSASAFPLSCFLGP